MNAAARRWSRRALLSRGALFGAAGWLAAACAAPTPTGPTPSPIRPTTPPPPGSSEIGDGLAVRGEEVTQDRSQIIAWLQAAGLPSR